jgi:nucleosome-remodeling factor subunit BPTF
MEKEDEKKPAPADSMETDDPAESEKEKEKTAESMDVEETLKATEIDKNAPKIATDDTSAHLTRSKTNQITNGTFYFKLGMKNNFKTYVNQRIR